MQKGNKVFLTSILVVSLCIPLVFGKPKKPQPPQFEPNEVWAGFDCGSVTPICTSDDDPAPDNFTRTAETVYESSVPINIDFELGTPDLFFKDKAIDGNPGLTVCTSLGGTQSATIDPARFVFRSDQGSALARWGWDDDDFYGESVQLRWYCGQGIFDDLPFEEKTTYIVCDSINVRVDWPKGPNTECVWEFGKNPTIDDAPVFTIVDD